jgi:hypothetical protein
MAEIKVTLSTAAKSEFRLVAFDAGYKRLNASLEEVGDIQAMTHAWIKAGIQARRERIQRESTPAVDMSDVSITGTDD